MFVNTYIFMCIVNTNELSLPYENNKRCVDTGEDRESQARQIQEIRTEEKDHHLRHRRGNN